MNNVFIFVCQHILNALRISFAITMNEHDITVEIPNNQEHGELSTNAALVVAKTFKKNPREVALTLLSYLKNLEFVADIKVEGPGFINMSLTESFWNEFLKKTLSDGKRYGFDKIGNGQKINLEFVSANPTGPLHIGHTRGAIYGDAIARILKAVGYDVVKEYYINDAGNQIATLLESLKIRYKNLSGANLEVPEGCYPGEYLIDIAVKAKSRFKDDIELIDSRILIDFTVNEIMSLIKDDLKAIGVEHDVFISEYHDIIKKGNADKAIELLQNEGLLYMGTLDAPKSLDDQQSWQSEEQTIFRATNFGDESDRVIIKADGTYTYFMGDIAYHYQKISRGFNEMILLLGADHSGYVKRISAIVSALSKNKANIDLKINQLVNLYKDGKPVRMSKRSGNVIKVDDVLAEIDKDTFRFVMLSKKNDTHLDIDFAKLREHNKDNPVWYVQYAHTRAHSVIRRAKDLGVTIVDDQEISHHKEDMTLIKTIALYPKVLRAAAIYHEPHRINYYLQELAHCFHQLWSLGDTNAELRFINDRNVIQTKARLVLVHITANILASGLDLLGIEPVYEM